MRCFLQTKKNLRADNEDWSAKRVGNVARAICVKRTGQKFVKHSNSIDSMFNVTFGESGKPKEISFAFKTDLEIIEKSKVKELRPEYEINDPDSILVVGRAIWATESKNYNRYSEKELKKASKTLIGAPCQIDHSESARDTFGIVTDAWWDNGSSPPEIAYIAELDGSEVVAQRVKKKYVRGVSVAGSSEKTLCSICGKEWDWAHEHYPGQEYTEEKNKKKKKIKCFLDHIDISFRHLGFTAFPAIAGADANYIAASVSEALENVNAYISHATEHGYNKTQPNEYIAPAATVGAFGETTSMSVDPEAKILVEKLKLLEKSELDKTRLQKEKAELEAKLVVLEKARADSDKDLEALKEAEKKRLISEIVDLQDKLGLTKGRKAEERRVDLADEHILSITAKVEALRDMWEEEEKKTPPQGSIISEGITGHSRSRTFKGSKFDELDPERKGFYEREAKLERYAIGLFGHRPSVGAVQILSEWNGNLDRWNTDFADMFKTVPKLADIRRSA